MKHLLQLGVVGALGACVSGGSGMEGASDSDATTGSTNELPSECMDLSSPFLEADCLDGLQSKCREHITESECVSQTPFVFGEGSFVIHCGWAKMVTFADADACTVESVAGRCEAGREQTLLGCGDPCFGEPDINTALHAIVSELALIEMPCTPSGNSLGPPLSSSAAVGSDLEIYARTCAPNLEPPAPELCDCAPIACESQ